MRERRLGRRASSVHFDAKQRRVVVELSNGLQVAFPIAALPEIAAAPDSDLAQVTLSPSGSGIVWSELDADFSVSGLLAWAAGTHASASALGRVGGSKSSKAKAAAARSNGARGGRPAKRGSVRAAAKHARGPRTRSAAV
ncbi:MAG: DUF2442 domain-containing protein [Gemmatimonadaceae bacterium]